LIRGTALSRIYCLVSQAQASEHASSATWHEARDLEKALDVDEESAAHYILCKECTHSQVRELWFEDHSFVDIHLYSCKPPRQEARTSPIRSNPYMFTLSKFSFSLPFSLTKKRHHLTACLRCPSILQQYISDSMQLLRVVTNDLRETIHGLNRRRIRCQRVGARTTI